MVFGRKKLTSSYLVEFDSQCPHLPQRLRHWCSCVLVVEIQGCAETKGGENGPRDVVAEADGRLDVILDDLERLNAVRCTVGGEKGDVGPGEAVRLNGRVEPPGHVLGRGALREDDKIEYGGLHDPCRHHAQVGLDFAKLEVRVVEGKEVVAVAGPAVELEADAMALIPALLERGTPFLGEGRTLRRLHLLHRLVAGQGALRVQRVDVVAKGRLLAKRERHRLLLEKLEQEHVLVEVDRVVEGAQLDDLAVRVHVHTLVSQMTTFFKVELLVGRLEVAPDVSV